VPTQVPADGGRSRPRACLRAAHHTRTAGTRLWNGTDQPNADCPQTTPLPGRALVTSLAVAVPRTCSTWARPASPGRPDALGRVHLL